VFGDAAKKVPMSSIKSQLGHMITASGVVAAQTCLLAMRDSMLPPTINLNEPDPECDLDYVPNHARKSKVNAAIANSFGFGGQNVCLVLKKYE
jgi:3-oxoacyl-[acyl-carrier-protein] synthase II